MSDESLYGVMTLLRFGFDRRMFPDGIKRFAQVDHAGTIHSQSRQRGAANRRYADDEHEIPVPGEMFMPRLKTRMKQRNASFG